MPSFIVIRLHPATPTDPTSFASALDSLTVRAFDLSFHQPRTGQSLGSAAYHPPTVALKPRPFPPKITYPPGTGIAQHLETLDDHVTPISVQFRPVATALIELPAALAEYQTVDLRLVLERASSKIDDRVVYYNVPVLSSGPLSPD